ncbi:hypothetical protein AHF37_07846 [Paragonimus kellicotti]|nr:hypothetical protein AHF37_07846 [Paragonimus kellicotti]
MKTESESAHQSQHWTLLYGGRRLDGSNREGRRKRRDINKAILLRYEDVECQQYAVDTFATR